MWASYCKNLDVDGKATTYFIANGIISISQFSSSLIDVVMFHYHLLRAIPAKRLLILPTISEEAINDNENLRHNFLHIY
jgi:hypothetical protein